MAETQQPPGEGSFVSQLAGDPNKLGRYFVIYGFRGTAPDKDYTRIFLDAALNRYVDVLQNTIAHEEAVQLGPHQGVCVWLKKQVIPGPTPSQLARLFRGPIAQTAPIPQYVRPLAAGTAAVRAAAMQRPPIPAGVYYDDTWVSTVCPQYCGPQVYYTLTPDCWGGGGGWGGGYDTLIECSNFGFLC